MLYFTSMLPYVRRTATQSRDSADKPKVAPDNGKKSQLGQSNDEDSAFAEDKSLGTHAFEQPPTLILPSRQQTNKRERHRAVDIKVEQLNAQVVAQDVLALGTQQAHASPTPASKEIIDISGYHARFGGEKNGHKLPRIMHLTTADGRQFLVSSKINCGTYGNFCLAYSVAQRGLVACKVSYEGQRPKYEKAWQEQETAMKRAIQMQQFGLVPDPLPPFNVHANSLNRPPIVGRPLQSIIEEREKIVKLGGPVRVFDHIVADKKHYVFMTEMDSDLYSLSDQMPATHRHPFILATMAALCEHMAWMHAKGWTHQDVKLANALVHNSSGIACLADLDSGRPLNDGLAVNTGLSTYPAPEQHQRNAFITHKADIWGLGMMLGEACVPMVRHPLLHAYLQSDMTDFQAHEAWRNQLKRPDGTVDLSKMRRYADVSATPFDKYYERVYHRDPQACLDMLQHLLIFEPEQRISAAQYQKILVGRAQQEYPHLRASQRSPSDMMRALMSMCAKAATDDGTENRCRSVKEWRGATQASPPARKQYIRGALLATAQAMFG